MLGQCRIGFVLAVFLLVSIGCGRGGGDSPAATSQEELAEFLEENPKYSDSSSAPKPSKAPLELGR
jgi:hypothetical protein